MDGAIVPYVQTQRLGLGRIGVLVALESTADKQPCELGKQIAMHIAATSPASLSIEDLDGEAVSANGKCY